MKKILFGLLLLPFIGISQKKPVKKTVKKEVIGICKLPLLEDSIMFVFGEPGKGMYITYKNGTKCHDTTGLAKEKRKKLIGDTTILEEINDTIQIALLTMVDGIKLKTIGYKVVFRSYFMTSNLYEDTLTKEHSLGNSSWGNMRPSSYIYPFQYLQHDKTPFPKDIKIYGEYSTN